MFSPPRRRRRYGWWLVILVVAFVGLALLTGGIRTETRELTAFFDESRTLALDSDQVADDFRNLIRNDLQNVTREDFEVLMERLEDIMATNAEAVRAIDRPDSAFAAGELLTLAFDSCHMRATRAPRYPQPKRSLDIKEGTEVGGERSEFGRA